MPSYKNISNKKKNRYSEQRSYKVNGIKFILELFDSAKSLEILQTVNI